MLGLIAGATVGIGLGSVTGIIPGVHSNTVAGAVLSSEAVLLPVIGTDALAGLLFAMLVTHTFIDAVPSAFLGVPDPDTAVSVLPLHALCLEGRGEEAVRLSALGSVLGILAGIPVAVCALLFLPPLQPYLDWGTGLILISIMGLFILLAEAPGRCFLVFLFSGALGTFAMHYSFLCWSTGGPSAVLLPLLAGLFGLPVLLFSKKGIFPEQHPCTVCLERGELSRSTLAGTAAGVVVGWLPGLSNSAANGLLSPFLLKKNNREAYILASSAANTCNIMIGVAALTALSRTRNGVMAALASFEFPPVYALFAVGAIAGCVAYVITIGLSRRVGVLSGLDSRFLNRAVLGGIIFLCAVLTGPFGLFILLIATLIGITPDLFEIPRVACIGAITVPVILFTLGFSVA